MPVTQMMQLRGSPGGEDIGLVVNRARRPAGTELTYNMGSRVRAASAFTNKINRLVEFAKGPQP